MGLYSESQIYSIDQYAYPCAGIILLDHSNFVVSSEIKKHESYNFVFLFQHCLAFLGLRYFCMNLKLVNFCKGRQLGF